MCFKSCKVPENAFKLNVNHLSSYKQSFYWFRIFLMKSRFFLFYREMAGFNMQCGKIYKSIFISILMAIVLLIDLMIIVLFVFVYV